MFKQMKSSPEVESTPLTARERKLHERGLFVGIGIATVLLLFAVIWPLSAVARTRGLLLERLIAEQVRVKECVKWSVDPRSCWPEVAQSQPKPAHRAWLPSSYRR